MSRHSSVQNVTVDGKPILTWIHYGYDRPLRVYFLQIDDPEEDYSLVDINCRGYELVEYAEKYGVELDPMHVDYCFGDLPIPD